MPIPAWLGLAESSPAAPKVIKTEPAANTPGYVLATRSDGAQFLLPDPNNPELSWENKNNGPIPNARLGTGDNIVPIPNARLGTGDNIAPIHNARAPISAGNGQKIQVGSVQSPTNAAQVMGAGTASTYQKPNVIPAAPEDIFNLIGLPELQNQNFHPAYENIPRNKAGEPAEGYKSTGGFKQNSGTVTTEATPLPSKTYNDLLDRVTNGLPGLLKQRKNLSDIGGTVQGLAGLAKQEYGKLDLSPLLALSDSEFGGNLLRGYTAPQKRALAIGQPTAELAQTLLNAGNGIAQGELGLFNSNLKDKTQTNLGTSQFGSRTDLAGSAGENNKALFEAIKLALGGGSAGTSPGVAETIKQHQITNDRNAQLDAQRVQDKIDKEVTTFVGKRDKFLPSIGIALKELDELARNNGGKLPGYGDIMGDLENPLHLSSEAKSVQRALETLKASVINNYTGKAGSEQEAVRIARSLGQGKMQGEEQVRKGLMDLQAAVRKVEQEREGALSEGAHKRAKDKGIIGVDSLDFNFISPPIQDKIGDATPKETPPKEPPPTADSVIEKMRKMKGGK